PPGPLAPPVAAAPGAGRVERPARGVTAWLAGGVKTSLYLGLSVGQRLVQIGSVDRSTDRLHPRPFRVVEQVTEGQRVRRVAVLEPVRDQLGARVGRRVLVARQVGAARQVAVLGDDVD